jgi:hypothetical protein
MPVILLGRLRSGELQFRSFQTEQFVTPHLSGKKMGEVTCACHPNDGGKCKIEGLQSRPTWAKSNTLE